MTRFLPLLFSLAVEGQYARPELLVETDWLQSHLSDPAIRIVDVRTKGYEEGHIKGAVHLDIETSRDAKNPPTYLPDRERFVDTLETLGISNGTRVVFYDDQGGIYGTRPWVLLQMLGHPDAAILNGGWTKWTTEGRGTSREVPEMHRGKLDVKAAPRWIATADDVAAAIGNDDVRIVDARTEGEIAGTDLRGNPRGGAVPSSIPLYWEDTLAGDSRTFKTPAELARLFSSHGLDPKREVITYCQGGGRAAHEIFVLHLMGYDDLRLYLGSWEDWSRRQDLPLASASSGPRK
jgi:thiosulfate/3-mercaptopyruvate sulfurtransferase